MAVKLSQGLKEEFASFLQQHPPQQFSTHLRQMLLQYLIYEIRSGTPLEFKDLLMALSDLFDLLDIAAREFPQHKTEADIK